MASLGFSQSVCSLLYLPFAIRNRDDAGAGAALCISSHDYEFLLGIWRHGAQRFFASMFQNQRDRFTKVRDAFFARLALTVSPRHLCAIGDILRAALFDNCRELIAHGPILALPQRCKLPASRHLPMTHTLEETEELESGDRSIAARCVPSISKKD